MLHGENPWLQSSGDVHSARLIFPECLLVVMLESIVQEAIAAPLSRVFIQRQRTRPGYSPCSDTYTSSYYNFPSSRRLFSFCLPPDLDCSIGACGEHLPLLGRMMLSPSDDFMVDLRWWVWLQWFSIKQVPCPNRSLLVSAYHTCFAVPEAGPTAIFIVDVPGEIIEQLPVGHVHEADVRVERSNQQSLAVLRRDNGSYGIAHVIGS